ncbi:hypothetical protein [Fluviispira sanaruensis]|uniref:Uncharacterized protein n=1 Tax=Fluviispira sanaruensis TaxID=2493639 RepID=A0A4P2VJW3_FLUSA|nr:hypothetical protein [Fluviispira sanaruensis]BBH53486.1 hypothetical protein JCM31447_19300 [Fluviispira sanaruensis]
MSDKKILFDVKNNQYFSLDEAQDILTFNKASAGTFLVIESEKKVLVETNEVFLFQKDFYVFIDLEEKISLLSTNVKGEKLFLMLTDSLFQFLENQINNGVLFCIIQIIVKKIFKNWRFLLLFLFFIIALQQKQFLSLENESYTYKYQLKKNIYAVYKDILRKAQHEIRTEPNLLSRQKMGIALSNEITENNKLKKIKEQVIKVKKIEPEPDINFFLKLKKAKRE